MSSEINNPTHNEEVFRNFIRSNQLSAKWHEFVKENPLENKDISSEKKVYGVFDGFNRLLTVCDTEEKANLYIERYKWYVSEINKKTLGKGIVSK